MSACIIFLDGVWSSFLLHGIITKRAKRFAFTIFVRPVPIDSTGCVWSSFQRKRDTEKNGQKNEELAVVSDVCCKAN